jgi:hypothetical protein
VSIRSKQDLQMSASCDFNEDLCAPQIGRLVPQYFSVSEKAVLPWAADVTPLLSNNISASSARSVSEVCFFFSDMVRLKSKMFERYCSETVYG